MYVNHVKWINNISTVPVIILNQINVEHVKLNAFWVNSVVAMRKVASGHSMIVEGHKTVAEGWRMFEEAVDELMPRDLPQLLRQLKEKTMLMPPPLPMDIGQATQQTQPVAETSSPVKREGGSKNEEPVIVMISGHRNWACPQSNTVQGLRNGCDAHIRQAHTGKALVCSFCSFSTYNMDSLTRHEKEHK